MIDVNNCAAYGLNKRQAEIVNLIEQRFNRAAIAAHLGISKQLARDVIGGMCDFYDCRAHDLPMLVLGFVPAENPRDKL